MRFIILFNGYYYVYFFDFYSKYRINYFIYIVLILKINYNNKLKFNLIRKDYAF